MAASASAAADDYEDEKKPHSYATFEDYLDDQVTEEDKYYLGVRMRLPFSLHLLPCSGWIVCQQVQKMCCFISG